LPLPATGKTMEPIRRCGELARFCRCIDLVELRPSFSPELRG